MGQSDLFEGFGDFRMGVGLRLTEEVLRRAVESQGQPDKLPYVVLHPRDPAVKILEDYWT